MGEPVLFSAGKGDSVSLRGTEVTFKVKSDQAERASCTEWLAAAGIRHWSARPRTARGNVVRA